MNPVAAIKPPAEEQETPPAIEGAILNFEPPEEVLGAENKAPEVAEMKFAGRTLKPLTKPSRKVAAEALGMQLLSPNGEWIHYAATGGYHGMWRDVAIALWVAGANQGEIKSAIAAPNATAAKLAEWIDENEFDLNETTADLFVRIVRPIMDRYQDDECAARIKECSTRAMIGSLEFESAHFERLEVKGEVSMLLTIQNEDLQGHALSADAGPGSPLVTIGDESSRYRIAEIEKFPVHTILTLTKKPDSHGGP